MALTSKIIDVKGRATEVLEGGTGEPLVFLHGGTMVGGTAFLDAITERVHVYAPLFPGYGRTELEPAVGTRDAVGEHLRDVLDALGLDRVALVGHSLGGWRAARFAASHPERVKRLVLGAPPGMPVPGYSAPNMLELTPRERLDVLTYDESIKQSWIPSVPDPDFTAAREQEQKSMARFAPGPTDADLPTLVGSIKAETLLLWGEGDRLFPVAHAQVWVEALPHVELRTYPGTGHLLFHERPEAVKAAADFAVGTAG